VAQCWRAVELADPNMAFSNTRVMAVVLAAQGRYLERCTAKVQAHKPCALAAVQNDWRAIAHCGRKIQVWQEVTRIKKEKKQNRMNLN